MPAILAYPVTWQLSLDINRITVQLSLEQYDFCTGVQPDRLTDLDGQGTAGTLARHQGRDSKGPGTFWGDFQQQLPTVSALAIHYTRVAAGGALQNLEILLQRCKIHRADIFTVFGGGERQAESVAHSHPVAVHRGLNDCQASLATQQQCQQYYAVTNTFHRPCLYLVAVAACFRS